MEDFWECRHGGSVLEGCFADEQRWQRNYKATQYDISNYIKEKTWLEASLKLIIIMKIHQLSGKPKLKSKKEATFFLSFFFL